MTRGNRLAYLARAWDSVFKQRPGMPVHLMLAANGPSPEVLKWLDEHRGKFSLLTITPHNRGQNIPMNEFLDEAVKIRASWFCRVDDDCFFEQPAQWLAHMLKTQRWLLDNIGSYAVLGPQVNGLRNPPETLATARMPNGAAESVCILGGICRLAPMPLLRYFRFNERMPMGSGEAMQLANFCASKHVPMVRDTTMVVTHGESTQAQEAADPNWTYEHAMLQAIPYGL